jgi:hypothetical protein
MMLAADLLSIKHGIKVSLALKITQLGLVSGAVMLFSNTCQPRGLIHVQFEGQTAAEAERADAVLVLYTASLIHNADFVLFATRPPFLLLFYLCERGQELECCVLK